MEIKFIKSIVCGASDVPIVLDRAGVRQVPINKVNWANQYPYCPEVSFRIAYNDLAILLHYKVIEDSIRALYNKDNGKVWTDSCVEFFCEPSEDGIYYNLETNCIGTVLLGAGYDRNNRELANIETTESIQRWASLGRKGFKERKGCFSWELSLIVPYTAFFKHRIRSMVGQTIGANFYKCGDELQRPHYLSWTPIKFEKPDFHRPDFFGKLKFSK